MNQMRRALISVSDKTNLIPFAKYLLSQNIQIISSGGTCQYLHDNIDSGEIHEISDLTDFPEILGGRVKTLHPIVHGGILAQRSNENHLYDLRNNGISPIDLIIVNLYPFESTPSIETIDIGGHTLLRAAAKNYEDVLVIHDINDYDLVVEDMKSDRIDLEYRKKMAAKTFEYIAHYDMCISNHFNSDGDSDKPIHKYYEPITPLKYGINPQQNNAGLYLEAGKELPFRILHGTPGYINLLDAIYSWNLVLEIKKSLGLPAAASFKHTSPAGVGIGIPLSDELYKAYLLLPAQKEKININPVSLAFLRARNADPMCSYGDLIAINETVDEDTALLISREVSDGIIAAGYTPEAEEILSKKKGGRYIILEGRDIEPGREIRQLHGVTLIQDENTRITSYIDLDKSNIVTENSELPSDVARDMIMANITLKYTQSNSVVFAYDGQAIGIGAGQQSRIDCVKLARRKAENWFLRHHPSTLQLIDCFADGLKKQEKINAIIQFIDNDFTEIEYENWKELFSFGSDDSDNIPIPKLTSEMRGGITNDGIVLASDAFFPFRDNIDTASKIGVKYIIQPGGSIADDEVIRACDDYGMLMVMTGSDMRMFLH